MLEHLLAFLKYFPELNAHLAAGVLILARFIGFMMFAPVLSRKDIPGLLKISFAAIMTVMFVGILNPESPPKNTSLLLSIILNVTFGAIIGYVAALIFATITAAGDMINMQMGLSSAVMFDSSSREQTTVIGKFFGYLGTVIFINAGGIYWIIFALYRSFSIFPIYGTTLPLDKVINMTYLVHLTGNVLFIGLQMAAPVLVATLAMDMILGIISKIAPQINVFQLSFLFKPLVGTAIILILLPLLISIINDYFITYARIY